MIIHCCECGKAASSKLDHCPYCNVGFIDNAQTKISKFHFFQRMALSLRSLFF